MQPIIPASQSTPEPTSQEGLSLPAQPVARKPWHAPVIRHISMTRTLNNDGSLSDGHFGSTSE